MTAQPMQTCRQMLPTPRGSARMVATLATPMGIRISPEIAGSVSLSPNQTSR